MTSHHVIIVTCLLSTKNSKIKWRKIDKIKIKYKDSSILWYSVISVKKLSILPKYKSWTLPMLVANTMNLFFPSLIPSTKYYYSSYDIIKPTLLFYLLNFAEYNYLENLSSIYSTIIKQALTNSGTYFRLFYLSS